MQAIKMILDVAKLEEELYRIKNIVSSDNNNDYRWLMSKETETALKSAYKSEYIELFTFCGVKVIIDSDIPFGEVELYIRGECW